MQWYAQHDEPRSGPHPLTSHEIALLSSSDADPTGKLFQWRDRLFRGIYRSRAPFCHRLFDSGLIDRLVEKRLFAPVQRTDLCVEGFPLVLEHERIPFVTYPFEWCPAMQRQAALHILELQEELTREDLSLFDAHSFNAIFSTTKPVFVDLGSIVERSSDGVWHAWDEFCRYNLYPLALASAGEARVARALLRDFRHAVPEVIASRVCPDLAAYTSHRQTIFEHCDLAGRLRFLDDLRRDISAIPLRRSSTEWSEYYGADIGSLDFESSWRLQQQTFWKVLDRIRPRTLIDIASNRGLYGQIAVRYGVSVVAFDCDETAVTDMYEDARRHGLPLLPAIMDLLDPSPALGLNNAWFPPGRERLYALASALVHHLVFKMQLDFGQISAALASFASRWLLVEFIPREDRYVAEWWTEERSWYTMEHFIASLRKHLRTIEILPSDPEPRVFLLCEGG